jgi:hypothetical protein
MGTRAAPIRESALSGNRLAGVFEVLTVAGELFFSRRGFAEYLVSGCGSFWTRVPALSSVAKGRGGRNMEWARSA